MHWNFSLTHFALHVALGFNVNLSFLFITNSTQVGLLCLNLLGSSGIHDSEITHSNYRLLEKFMQGEVECSVDNWECCGRNVWVVFVNSQVNVGSNISTFAIERTKISYGVNLSPNIDSIFLGAGVVFHLNSGLRYDLHITLDKCTFRNNIAPYAAHLYLGIFSSCSVSVKDSNFTYANRITEGNPMELVPVVHPARGTIGLQASDGDTALAIDVEIVMNVHITENVGVASLLSFF